MRRLAFVATAVLAGCVATGPASAKPYEPVVGSGSYNEAPLLEPGQYSDTIRGSETNIYAISVPPGQSLRADVALEKRPISGTEASVSLDALIDGPGRVPLAGDNDPLLFATPGAQLTGRLQAPAAVEPEDGLSDDDYPAAGVWYLRLSVDDPNDEVGPVEFPIRLGLSLAGTATGEAPPPIASQESVEPTTPADDSGDDTDTATGEDDGGGSGAGTVLIVAVVAGVAGGIGGIFMTRRKGTSS